MRPLSSLLNNILEIRLIASMYIVRVTLCTMPANVGPIVIFSVAHYTRSRRVALPSRARSSLKISCFRNALSSSRSVEFSDLLPLHKFNYHRLWNYEKKKNKKIKLKLKYMRSD